MALSITGRGYSVQGFLASGFLLANSGQHVTELINIEADGVFKSDPQIPVQVVNTYELKLLGANWSDFGFMPHQIIDLSGSFNDGNGTTSTLLQTNTIQDINGDTMTLVTPLSINPVFVGSMLPQGTFNSILNITITGLTVEQIVINHNLTYNSNQLSLPSLIDGEHNTFEFNGINSMIVGATIQGIQLGLKSGGAYTASIIERLADAGTRKKYRITLQYFLPDYDGDSTIPDWFAGIEALKSVFRISAHSQMNNPNGVQIASSSSHLGNTGWYNEEHNQGVNDFVISSVNIFDSLSNPIQTIDYSQVCKVDVLISGLVPPDPDVEVKFDLLPDNNYFKNNQFTHAQNRHTSYIKPSLSLAFGRAGEQIALQNLSTTVTGNDILVSFETNPNAAFTNFINNSDPSQKNYRISVTVQNDSGVNNCVSLLVKEGVLEIAPIPDQPYNNVDEVGFIIHPQTLADPHTQSLESRTEDDIVFHSIFRLDKNVLWEELRLRTFVRRISDGAEFDLESKTIPFAQFPMVGGVLQFNYNEYIPQFLDSPDRNKIELRLTGTSAGIDYEVELISSMFNNWRDWLPNNNAFLDFYDLSLPNFGRSNEWVRYMQLAGYEIWTKATLVLDGIGYYFEAQNTIKDYDEDFSGVTVINLYDNNWNPVNALVAGQIMTIEAVHTLTSDTWLNPWGWISIRPYQNEINKRISTVWNWSSQDMPLLPEIGNTVASLSFPTPNVAVVRARVDTTNIDVDNVSIIARIEDTEIPLPCVSYLTFMVNKIEELAEDLGDDYDLAFEAFMAMDISEEVGICCPDCNPLVIASPEVFIESMSPACCLNYRSGVTPPIAGDPCVDPFYFESYAQDLYNTFELDLLIANSDNNNDAATLHAFLLSIDWSMANEIAGKINDRGIYFQCSDGVPQHGYLIGGGGQGLNNELDLIL